MLHFSILYDFHSVSEILVLVLKEVWHFVCLAFSYKLHVSLKWPYLEIMYFAFLRLIIEQNNTFSSNLR